MRIVVLGATGNVGTAVLHRLQAADEVEFDAWRWGDLSEACDLIVPFKRPAYEQVVAAFSHLAA